MSSEGPSPGASASGPTSSLSPGAVIADRYVLSHALGSGGMGVVWAARHRANGEMVALKFLRTGPEDPDSIKRFLRESRAAQSVRHKHVVAIREVLELADGRPVMVMELLAGETLRTRLTRDPQMGLEETARILLPVTSAVGTAHAQGIVHRDLKPDNIFLSEGPGGRQVKVLDFGIAKVTRAGDDHLSHGHGLTGSGEVLGTPNYMSPEQVFGERDLDQRSDIWALGVILYECLTGIVPTKAPNVGQVFKLIVAGGIKPLASRAPNLPADVSDLTKRMLARRRDNRPFDLNEIAAVLARYTDVAVPDFGPPHIPGVPSPDGPAPNAEETLRRMGASGIMDSQIGSLAEEQPRRARMGRLTTIGLGVLVVSVLVGESFLLWRGRAPKAVTEPAQLKPDAAVVHGVPVPRERRAP